MYFYFQPFRFYQKCITIFRNSTKDQLIKWQTTLQFGKGYSGFIIALPGTIQTINIDELFPGIKTKYIYVDWLEPPWIQTTPIKNVTRPIFKDIPRYKKHTYVQQTTRQTYYFVKYVLQERDTCDNLCEQVNILDDKYGYDYKRTEKDINCTDNISRSFSWGEAFLWCRTINATLPEFYSRKEK